MEEKQNDITPSKKPSLNLAMRWLFAGLAVVAIHGIVDGSIGLLPKNGYPVATIASNLGVFAGMAFGQIVLALIITGITCIFSKRLRRLFFLISSQVFFGITLFILFFGIIGPALFPEYSA